MANLLRQREFHKSLISGMWEMPLALNFMEVPEPEGTKLLAIDHDALSAIRRHCSRGF